MRPRLLDLFSCAGGAGMGYHLAGFDVTGVDINPQPEYPFGFHQGDALTLGAEMLASGDFDAVHASPPCQAFSSTKSLHNNTHPDLLDPTRALLVASGLPYVIENVVGAPLAAPLTLCGTEFGLRDGSRWLRRHRLFESNIDLWGAGGCHCHGRSVAGVYGHSDGPVYKEGRKGWSAPSDVARRLLGTPWITNRHALAQAIPPAFTQHIGEQLMSYVKERAA